VDATILIYGTTSPHGKVAPDMPADLPLSQILSQEQDRRNDWIVIKSTPTSSIAAGQFFLPCSAAQKLSWHWFQGRIMQFEENYMGNHALVSVILSSAVCEPLSASGMQNSLNRVTEIFHGIGFRHHTAESVIQQLERIGSLL